MNDIACDVSPGFMPLCTYRGKTRPGDHEVHRIGPVDGDKILSDNGDVRNRFRNYRTIENSYSFALARRVCRTGTGTNDGHRVTSESFLIGCGRYITTCICDPVRPEAFGCSL